MNTKLNSVFRAMKKRCLNPNDKSYVNYGARGITVCDEWLNSEKVYSVLGHPTKGYLAFQEWSLANGYEEGLTLDRIDNEKGYSPSNCRWVTRKVQNFNKRSNHYITYKGKTLALTQWAFELNMPRRKLDSRINKYHWSIERAFETP